MSRNRNLQDLLDHTFTVSSDCCFIKDGNSSFPLVKIIKLNDDQEFYQVSKVAAEIFLKLAEPSKVQPLKSIISSVKENYDVKFHSLIESKSLELVNNLIERNILQQQK